MVFKIITVLLLAGIAPMLCHAEFRDPTQPAYPLPSVADEGQAGSANRLVLSAIWISSLSKRATINGVTGKLGQTIEITQAPVIIPRMATQAMPAPSDSKTDMLLKKAMGPANEGAGQADQLVSLGKMVAPLLSAATGNNGLEKLLNQTASSTQPRAPELKQHPLPLSPANASGSAMPSASKIPLRTQSLSSRPLTIKIISIAKNAVTIDQNGELKTLHLVQSPYATQ